jgi:hypothetical protein
MEGTPVLRHLAILASASLLAACGGQTGIASAGSSPVVATAPAAPSSGVTKASDVAAVAGKVVVKADAALSIAERVYAAARYVAKIGISSGAVSPATAVLLRELDEQAAVALFVGRTAVDTAQQAQEAAKLLVIAGKVEKAAPAPE